METKKADILLDGEKVGEVIAYWDMFEFTGINGYKAYRNDNNVCARTLRKDAGFYAGLYVKGAKIGRFTKVNYYK